MISIGLRLCTQTLIRHIEYIMHACDVERTPRRSCQPPNCNACGSEDLFAVHCLHNTIVPSSLNPFYNLNGASLFGISVEGGV